MIVTAAFSYMTQVCTLMLWLLYFWDLEASLLGWASLFYETGAISDDVVLPLIICKSTFFSYWSGINFCNWETNSWHLTSQGCTSFLITSYWTRPSGSPTDALSSKNSITVFTSFCHSCCRCSLVAPEAHSKLLSPSCPVSNQIAISHDTHK